MAFKVREELVGKRFLCLNISEKPRGGRVGDWDWQAGIIRCASDRDLESDDFQVLVEFDGKDWTKRTWIKPFENFDAFLVEKTIVWAPRQDPKNKLRQKILWPGLTFKILEDRCKVKNLKVHAVESLQDHHLVFLEQSDIKAFKGLNEFLSPSSPAQEDPLVQEAVKHWTEYQAAQNILLTTPTVLTGYRLEVYRKETTQWYTAVIGAYNDSTKELTVLTDAVLQNRYEDPALVQMRLLGDGVVESILKGDDIGVAPRSRRACNQRHSNTSDVTGRSTQRIQSVSPVLASSPSSRNQVFRNKAKSRTSPKSDHTEPKQKGKNSSKVKEKPSRKRKSAADSEGNSPILSRKPASSSSHLATGSYKLESSAEVQEAIAVQPQAQVPVDPTARPLANAKDKQSQDSEPSKSAKNNKKREHSRSREKTPASAKKKISLASPGSKTKQLISKKKDEQKLDRRKNVVNSLRDCSPDKVENKNKQIVHDKVIDSKAAEKNSSYSSSIDGGSCSPVIKPNIIKPDLSDNNSSDINKPKLSDCVHPLSRNTNLTGEGSTIKAQGLRTDPSIAQVNSDISDKESLVKELHKCDCASPSISCTRCESKDSSSTDNGHLSKECEPTAGTSHKAVRQPSPGKHSHKMHKKMNLLGGIKRHSSPKGSDVGFSDTGINLNHSLTDQLTKRSNIVDKPNWNNNDIAANSGVSIDMGGTYNGPDRPKPVMPTGDPSAHVPGHSGAAQPERTLSRSSDDHRMTPRGGADRPSSVTSSSSSRTAEEARMGGGQASSPLVLDKKQPVQVYRDPELLAQDAFRMKQMQRHPLPTPTTSQFPISPQSALTVQQQQQQALLAAGGYRNPLGMSMMDPHAAAAQAQILQYQMQAQHPANMILSMPNNLQTAQLEVLWHRKFPHISVPPPWILAQYQDELHRDINHVQQERDIALERNRMDKERAERADRDNRERKEREERLEQREKLDRERRLQEERIKQERDREAQAQVNQHFQQSLRLAGQKQVAWPPTMGMPMTAPSSTPLNLSMDPRSHQSPRSSAFTQPHQAAASGLPQQNQHAKAAKVSPHGTQNVQHSPSHKTDERKMESAIDMIHRTIEDRLTGVGDARLQSSDHKLRETLQHEKALRQHIMKDRQSTTAQPTHSMARPLASTTSMMPAKPDQPKTDLSYSLYGYDSFMTQTQKNLYAHLPAGMSIKKEETAAPSATSHLAHSGQPATNKTVIVENRTRETVPGSHPSSHHHGGSITQGSPRQQASKISPTQSRVPVVSPSHMSSTNMKAADLQKPITTSPHTSAPVTTSSYQHFLSSAQGKSASYPYHLMQQIPGYTSAAVPKTSPPVPGHKRNEVSPAAAMSKKPKSEPVPATKPHSAAPHIPPPQSTFRPIITQPSDSAIGDFRTFVENAVQSAYFQDQQQQQQQQSKQQTESKSPPVTTSVLSRTSSSSPMTSTISSSSKSSPVSSTVTVTTSSPASNSHSTSSSTIMPFCTLPPIKRPTPSNTPSGSSTSSIIETINRVTNGLAESDSDTMSAPSPPPHLRASPSSQFKTSNHTKFKKAWLQRYTDSDKSNSVKSEAETEPNLNKSNSPVNELNKSSSDEKSNNSKSQNAKETKSSAKDKAKKGGKGAKDKGKTESPSSGSDNDSQSEDTGKSVAKGKKTRSPGKRSKVEEKEESIPAKKPRFNRKAKEAANRRDRKTDDDVQWEKASAEQLESLLQRSRQRREDPKPPVSDTETKMKRSRKNGATVSDKAKTNGKNVKKDAKNKSQENVSSALAEKPLNKMTVVQLKKTGDPFLQEDPCGELTTKLFRCMECKENLTSKNQQPANIFCRFYAFRRLKYNPKGALCTAGFSEPTDAEADDIELWMPHMPLMEPSLDPIMAKYLISNIGDRFCELVEQEKEAMSWVSPNNQIAWKRAVQGVREMCDVCTTTLFNVHWVCHRCGFDICIDCYKLRTSKGDTCKGKNCTQCDHHQKWMLCTNKQQHEPEKMMLTQIIPSDALWVLGRMIHEVREKWKIRANCPCGRSKADSVPNHKNGMRQMLNAVSQIEDIKPVVNGHSEDGMYKQTGVLNGNPLPQNNISPLSLLADAASMLDHKDGKKIQEALQEKIDGNCTTLRDLLTKQGAKKQALGSENKKPKQLTPTLDDILQHVVAQNVSKDSNGHENLTLTHYVPRNGPVMPGRESPIPRYTLTETSVLFPDVPHSWLDNGRLLRLHDPAHPGNLKLFQQQWRRAQPVLVSNCNKSLDPDLWSPEAFSRDFGNQVNDLVNCRDGVVIIGHYMSAFWKGFEHIKNRLRDENDEPMILKLKDWPPTEDFMDVQPKRFNNLVKSLPLPEYTNRMGLCNLASRLPEFFVKPDLGPKMYNAYGSALHPKEGTTNLHLDISDAVNMMVYVGVPKDDEDNDHERAAIDAIKEAGCCQLTLQRVQDQNELPGALWHIYDPQDADKIRDLLNLVANERGEPVEKQHDPIHDQSWYLDEELRKRLLDKYGVQGYTIVQCRGDAVLIPAGAPHQVRNLHSCIKIAEDFVSPENLDFCFMLTQEFRHLADTHSNHEDKLQVKNIIYHAVKDAVAVLKDADPVDL